MYLKDIIQSHFWESMLSKNDVFELWSRRFRDTASGGASGGSMSSACCLLDSSVEGAYEKVWL